MERNPYSELTREVLHGREHADRRKGLIEQISRIVYDYPKKHLHWDDDDSGDFFCLFYPKIEGLIDRFTYQGRPFEAYLAASIRWQLKTFAKKRVMQHSENRALQDESGFWFSCESSTAPAHQGSKAYHSSAGSHDENYLAEVTRVFKIEPDGKIGDPAWARRLLYLLLRNVAYIDDSLMEHCAKLSGFDPAFVLGCATELRERFGEKTLRRKKLIEKRNALHIRLLQLDTLLSDETDADRISSYRRQIGSVKARIEKASRDIRSSPLLATHRDIAEVLETAKGTVDSGLYYLRKAFSSFELN